MTAAAQDVEADFSALEAFHAEVEQPERLVGDNVADFLGSAMEEPDYLQQEIHEAWLEDEKRMSIEAALGHPLYDMPAALMLLWTLNTLVLTV